MTPARTWRLTFAPSSLHASSTDGPAVRAFSAGPVYVAMTSSKSALHASSVTAPSVADVYEYQTVRVRRSPAWGGSPGSAVASAVVPVTGTSRVRGCAAANASFGGGAAWAAVGSAAASSAAAASGTRRRRCMTAQNVPARGTSRRSEPPRDAGYTAGCATVAARTASASRRTPSSICSGVTPL